MGLEDRDYMSESKSNTNDVKVCPKTGHWIGTVDWADCSKCDFQSCNRKQFYKNVPKQVINPSDNQHLTVCIYCHEKSLCFNKVNNSFECLNSKCSNYNVVIPMISLNRNNQQIEAEEKAMNESIAKARVVMGNQIWNPKKGDWDNLGKPVRIHRIPTWLIIVGACIVVSIVITLILNHFQPGSRFSFFVW